MAADMAKARAGIARLKARDEASEFCEGDGRAIVDVIETFEWLDQSRTDAIEAREAAHRSAKLWQEEARRTAENADYWRERAEAAEAKIAAWAEASR